MKLSETIRTIRIKNLPRVKNSLSQLLAVFTLFLALSCSEKVSQEKLKVDIIPQPASITVNAGYFEINGNTKLFAEKGNTEALRIAGIFADKFKAASSKTLTVEETDESKVGDNGILFTSKEADKDLGNEGYEVEATQNSVTVKAPEAPGLFYGMQTLLQLLPAEIESTSPVIDTLKWTIPATSIKDKPRFSWRGLHLDVCRHMMPVAFIKKYIDNMAAHKLNTFHWHLTEDQGWRIEIKKYPKLTQEGAWRKETLIGHISEEPYKFDGKRYGGFYTQEEVMEVIQYAKDRFITIIPEIEMPGHSTAAISAYPRLGVTGKKPEVVSLWGVFPDIYNVDDSTFIFLEDVLTEVIALFPSKYIHIGGDEAPKDQWQASKKIQDKIKALGLKDEHELQSYFITRMEKFVNSKGRQIIGWDEILEGGLAPNAAVMSWRGESGGIAAAKSKHNVVMSPGSHLYFDYYQGDPSSEPLSIGGFLPLEKVYSYEPSPDTLSAEEAKYIMGAQANLWTEYIETPEKAEYMIFPRISALAEVVWSEKEDRNWEDFKTRIPKQLKRYEYKGLNYAKSIYDVYFQNQFDSVSNQYLVKLQNQFNEPEIHYTLDGSEPTNSSLHYSGPLIVDKTTTIKAGLFKNGVLTGKITQSIFEIKKALAEKVVQ